MTWRPTEHRKRAKACSAGELFFLISGYLVGYIHFRVDKYQFSKASTRMIMRASHLLAMNCVLFVSIFTLLNYFPANLQSSLHLDVAPRQGPFFAKELLTLGYNLPFLDILNVYIILLLASVPFGLLLAKKPLIACGLTAGLYVVANLAPQLSMPGGNLHGRGLWEFNPLGWQFLFLGSMIAGRYSLHEHFHRAMSENRYRRWILRVSVGVFAFFTAAHFIDANVSARMPWTNKTNLSPVRLAHAISTFITLAAILTAFPILQRSFVYKLLVTVGRNSLISFMASVILAFISVYFWHQERTMAAYLLASGISLGCLIIVATVADTLRAAQVRGDRKAVAEVAEAHKLQNEGQTPTAKEPQLLQNAAGPERRSDVIIA